MVAVQDNRGSSRPAQKWDHVRDEIAHDDVRPVPDAPERHREPGHARDRARRAKASCDLGRHGAPMNTDVERAVDGLWKGVRRVAPRREQHDAMPPRPELHRGIEDEPLRTAKAELGMDEGDLHGGNLHQAEPSMRPATHRFRCG